MAATDARPVPRKNAAFRFYFAIRKNDGTLITTWAGQDSEVSLDGAAFSDCTNEATEIGTSGTGYLDLTAAEMNADCVVLKITVTNTDALPLVFTFFPEESGDYRADAVMISGDSVAADNLEAILDGTGGVTLVASAITLTTPITANVTQFGSAAGTFSGGRPEVNTTHAAGVAWGSGAITAAAIASSAITSAKFASGAITSSVLASGSITAGTLAAGAISAGAIAASALDDKGNWLKPTVPGRTLDVSATGEAGIDWANIGSPTTSQNLSGTTISVSQAVASVSGSVGSVTGNVGGNVTGSVGSLAAQAKADVNAEVLDVMNVDTFAELSSPPSATPTLRQMLQYGFMWFRNKSTQTSTQRKLYADDGTTVVATESTTDDGTTYTKGEGA